jgi:hypothetical protein
MSQRTVTRGNAIDVAACAVIAFELSALAVIFQLNETSSIIISRLLISLIAAAFVGFLFGVVKNWGARKFSVAIAFILSNITAMILLFANIYRWLGLNDPLRHNHYHTTIWDAIYFSIITWTTVGYGDLTPALQSRSTAAFEAITGYVVMGLVISVLVIMAQRTD